MTPEDRKLLRHMVATIGYRAERALEGLPADFGEFEAGNGARTPRKVLGHVADLLLWSCRLVVEGPCAPERVVDEGWEEARSRFRRAVDRLDASLAQATELRERPEKLLQGPLGDALTHVGQLALLRRLAGQPMERHSYYRAAIEVPEAS